MVRSSRAQIAEQIARLAGHDVLQILDAGDGWPAVANLHLEGETLAVSLFASPVGLSHRGRDAVERRFQNPGSDRPITASPGRHPLLLGLWSADPQLPVTHPLLVTADPIRRLGRLTRFSVFVTVAGLLEASQTGWSTTISESHETIRCLLPPLLPISVSADRDGTPPSAMVQNAVAASGLTDTVDDPAAAARARRASMSLVRDARFANRVITSYGGRCAMCGLGVPLVQGAHIYPASAPGAPDQPWNGLALCPNHHLSFDRHLVAVRPGTGQIVFNSDVLEQAQSSPALRTLVDTTFPALATPDDPHARPRQEMFHRRYDYFVGHYEWLR